MDQLPFDTPKRGRGGDTHSPVPGDICKVEYYISTDGKQPPQTLVRRVTTNLTSSDANENRTCSLHLTGSHLAAYSVVSG